MSNEENNETEDIIKELKDKIENLRALAEKEPDLYLPELAMALNDYAFIPALYNNFQESEDYLNEVLDIYEELFKNTGDPYTQNKADTLKKLISVQENSGKITEACINLELLYDIYIMLAGKNPQRIILFLPFAAEAMDDLAFLQEESGYYDEAKICFKKELDIYRRLVKEGNDVYLPDLARNLNSLGALEAYMGSEEEAKKCFEESIHYYTELAEKEPEKYKQELNNTKDNLSRLLNCKKFLENEGSASFTIDEIIKKLSEYKDKESDPELEKYAYTAKYIHDLSPKEIARETGRSLNYVYELIKAYEIREKYGHLFSETGIALTTYDINAIKNASEEDIFKAIQLCTENPNEKTNIFKDLKRKTAKREGKKKEKKEYFFFGYSQN